MTRFQAGWCVLVALGAAIACDDGSAGRGPVAPDARAELAADRSGDGRSGSDHGMGRTQIAIRDDCDPRDQGWTPTGGCLLRRGDVTLAEFNGELDSPLAAAVIGHQAWRNDPPYLEIGTRRRVRVRNEGGRAHTFTEVVNFGGGRVPPLNEGLAPAPECATAVNIPPGGSADISGLAAGNHRFQCCIHPWMRALIKVAAHDDHSGHGSP